MAAAGRETKPRVTNLRRRDWFQLTGRGAATFGSADLDQVDHVLVLEQLQDLDFSQSRDWKLKTEKPEKNVHLDYN